MIMETDLWVQSYYDSYNNTEGRSHTQVFPLSKYKPKWAYALQRMFLCVREILNVSF